MDLRLLSQRTGIREHLLRTVRAEYVPGDTSELPEDDVLPLLAAVTLVGNGLSGEGVRTFLKRTRSQLRDHHTLLAVDYRGDVPLRVQIDLTAMRARVGQEPKP